MLDGERRPPVEMPRRRECGSSLLERGLACYLAGEARLTFAREGLVYTIDDPLTRSEEEEPSVPS